MAASRSVQFKYTDVYNRRVVGGATCDEKNCDTEQVHFINILGSASCHESGVSLNFSTTHTTRSSWPMVEERGSQLMIPNCQIGEMGLRRGPGFKDNNANVLSVLSG